LRDLKPDLIVTQDLCSVCSIDLAAVQRLAATLPSRPRIVSLNPHTFEAVLDDLLTLGQATGLEHNATTAITHLRERVYRACDYVNAFDDGPTVAFLEWTDPLFCAGHWTPQLIERAGAQHPLNPTQPLRVAGAAAGPVGTTLRTAGKSVTVPPEVLVALKPQRLIIAPCGWPLDRIEHDLPRLQSQWWWNQLPAAREGQVALVDGNQYFNRPGPRLVDAFEWLVGWLNDRPELMPRDFAWRAMP
jgi:ABC-type Fe3+-hydroxamate transport system substrate-binding protein